MSHQAPKMFVSQYSKKKPTLLAQQTGKKKKENIKRKSMAKQKFMYILYQERNLKETSISHKKT